MALGSATGVEGKEEGRGVEELKAKGGKQEIIGPCLWKEWQCPFEVCDARDVFFSFFFCLVCEE